MESRCCGPAERDWEVATIQDSLRREGGSPRVAVAASSGYRKARSFHMEYSDDSRPLLYGSDSFKRMMSYSYSGRFFEC